MVQTLKLQVPKSKIFKNYLEEIKKASNFPASKVFTTNETAFIVNRFNSGTKPEKVIL